MVATTTSYTVDTLCIPSDHTITAAYIAYNGVTPATVKSQREYNWTRIWPLVPSDYVTEYHTATKYPSTNSTVCGGWWHNFYDSTNNKHVEVLLSNEKNNYADASSACSENQAQLLNLSLTADVQLRFIQAIFDWSNNVTSPSGTL